MQIQNFSSPVGSNNTAFNGKFIIKDARIIADSKKYSGDMFQKLNQLEGVYTRENGSKSIVINSYSGSDLFIFKQLKELGLKFMANISG